VPILGPAIGPILGGLITQGAGWPWIFWAVSIFDALLIIWAIFFFRETYAPPILYEKAMRLRKTSNQDYHTEFELSNPKLSTTLWISLTRPYRLLTTQPIIQLMSLYLAYNFGILYIVLSTFASLWIDRYDQSASTSGLHYLALAIDYTIAAQVGGPITDRIWRHLQNKAGGTTAPEYRVPLMIPGALLIPIGLFWYDWAAEARVHWIVPDIGASVFGCGIILGTQAMQAYVMDSYSQHMASAMAAALLLRSIIGFAFPTFAPVLFDKLGYGWGNSILAFAFIAIGVSAPLFLWKLGARIRTKGKPQQ
jgi:MFS family permease